MTISNAHLIPCFTFCIPLSHLSHSCVPVVANDRSADLCYLLAYYSKKDRSYWTALDQRLREYTARESKKVFFS